MRYIIVAISLCLFLFSSTRVYAQSTVPQLEAKKALVGLGWNPIHAERITRRVSAMFDSRVLPTIGNFAGMYNPGCPGHIVIGYKADSKVILEHEYHHAWDHQDCTWITDAARIDIKLLDLDEARRADAWVRANDNIHLNHVLITYLNFDYAKLPEWYRVKYFNYSVKYQVFLPNVRK